MKTAKRDYKRIVALALVSAMIALVWSRTGFYFETNDEKYITQILCGLETGQPEPRTVYVSYLLALPLSLLYRVTSRIPWFGMTLVLFQAFAYVSVLESIYSRRGKGLEAAAGTILASMLILANFYLLGCISYTATAALMAVTGYFCFLVHRDTKRRWIYFGLFEILGGMLRINAMLMMQPMGMLLMCGMILNEKEMPGAGGANEKEMPGTGGAGKERLLLFGRAVMVPAAAVLVLLLTDAFVYRDSSWKAYHKFNDAEVVLFDYGGAPDYAEVKDILDRYQVTEADYNAYQSYMILDWVLSPECAGEVAEYAREHRERDISVTWEELKRNMWQDSHWGLNHVLLFLWAVAAVELLLVRKLSLLFAMLALFSGKMISWGALLYQGRFPLRISMPLLAGEVMLLTALILVYGEWADKRVRYGLFLVFTAGMCATVVPAGRQQYRYVRKENEGQEVYMEGLREIGEYCNAHPGNRYIIDMGGALTYYKGSALEWEIYQDRNYIFSGSWYSNSPGIRHYNAQYLKGQGVYFLVYDDGRGESHPGVVHLAQRTGAEPEVSDSFTAANGVPYLVYYFEGEYCIEEP